MESGIVPAVSTARTSEAPAGGRRQAAEAKWKELYAGAVGRDRFDAADADGDGILTKEEGAAALMPGERRRGSLMARRYDRHAGEDGLLSRSEASAGRRFERTNADAIWRALARWRG